MTIDKEIEDLRSAVVSQLVTRKPAHGIPLDAVVRDYKELNGEHIPYRKYGFSTLVDFLKTIPELEVYSRGVAHYINFKGKESFKHVTDLIARTRPKLSRNYKGSANYRSHSVGMRKTVPPGYKPPQDYNNRPYESTSSSSSIIDPAVTSEILSIIKECPSGLFLSELLEKLYNRSRLNLSNNQIQEHLKMLEREVASKDNMIYLRKSSPRDSFAPRSSRSQSVPPRRHNNNQSRYSNETNGNRNYDKYYGNGNYQSNYGNTSTEINYSKNASSNNKNFKIAGVDSDEDLNNDYYNDFDSGPSLAENEYVGIHSTNAKNNNNTQYHDKSGDTISDSREKDPEKITYKHDSSYNNNNTHESKVRSSNYHHESEAVNPKVNTSDDITKAENIDREILFQKNKKFVIESLSQRTVLRLQKLLENNPNGIWSLDLPTLYEKEYKLSLDWEKSNCQRFSDFVSYLPHIFHKIGPYRRGDYKLFDARKPIPDDDDKVVKQTPTLASVYNSYNNPNYYDESIPRRVSQEVRRKLFPLDVINDEETIECIQVSEFTPGTNELGGKQFQYVEVNVVEAFDPSFFWVQLSRNKDQFDDMMERLGTFYDENSSKYAIPQVLMVEKLNVACKFYGTWHRGMIKSVSPSLSSAKIHFYDFGTMKSYRADELFFLKRSFGLLPAQAIPCGLAGIEPKVHTGEGNGWPVETRDVFIKLAFKCEMWAMVQKIDLDNNSMLVGLTDTSDAEDLHIADFLLRHKLAAKSNTVRITTRNFFFKHALQSSAEWKKKYLNASVGNSSLARINRHKSVKFSSSDINKYRNHSKENAQKSSEALSPSMLRERAKSELKSKQIESQPSPVVLNYLPPPRVNLLSLGSSLDKVQLWFELNKELNKNSGDESSNDSIGANFEASKLEPIHHEPKSVPKKQTIKLEDIFKTSPAQDTSQKIEPHHVSKTSKPHYVSESPNHSLLKTPIEDHNPVKCKDVSNIIAVDDRADIPECGTFSSPLGGHGRAEPIDWNNIKQLLKKNERETLQSQSSSDETSSGNKAPVLSQPGVSKLLTAFDDEDDDKIPESGTFSSPLGGHGREEFLDWNAVRGQVEVTNDEKVSKSISLGKLSSAKPMVGNNNNNDNKPAGKSYLNDEAHRYFENFYQSCIAPKISKGNSILSWDSGDEVQYTGTITPMVRQTLNTINKKSRRVKVTVPVNVRRLIDGGPGSSSDSVSSGSQRSGWNSFDRPVSRSNNVEQKSDSDCRSSGSSKQVPTIYKLLKTRHLNSIKKSKNESSSDEKKEDSEKVNNETAESQSQKNKVLIEQLPSPKKKVLIEELPSSKKKVNSIYYASARISLFKKLNLQRESSIDDGSLDSDDSYCGASTRKEVASDSSNDFKKINNENSEINHKLTKRVNFEEEEKGSSDEKINEMLIEKLDSEESTKDSNSLNEKNNNDVNKLEVCVPKQPPKSMGVYNDLDPESDNSEYDYNLPLDFLANFFGVQLPNQKSITNSSAGTDTDGNSEDEKLQIEEINEKASSYLSESSLDISSARDNYLSPSSRVETDSESPIKHPKTFDNKKNLTKVYNHPEYQKMFKFEKNNEGSKKEFDSPDSDFQNSDREKIIRTPSVKLKCSILNEVKKSGLLESPKVIQNCNLSFNADDFLDSDK
ncbi:GSCOCG00004592001-RA-CDS [Cotesia congregata]|nr:GSCOCG00004592001-RA-CDS [Cotesia congregata]